MNRFIKYLAYNLFLMGIMFFGNLLGVHGLANTISIILISLNIVLLSIGIIATASDTSSNETVKTFIKEIKDKVHFRYHHPMEILWIVLAYKMNYNIVAFLMFIELGLLMILLIKVSSLRNKEQKS